jgi:hypothetical protein
MTTIMMFFKDLERYGIYKDSQFVLSIPQELLRELLDRWQEIEKKDNSPKEEKKDSFGRIKFTEEEWAELNNGSKGSDEHIVDTNEMIYPKTAFEILQPKLTIADTLEFREKHLPEILDAMEEYATSSQTEISDEEIEKAGETFHWDFRGATEFELSAFIFGAKWYREQLKNINQKVVK